MHELIDGLTAQAGQLAGLLWQNPITLLLLLGMGAFLTWKTRLVQLRALPHAFALLAGRHATPGADGQISHFQALATALSATVGTGNIAGVATAVSLGGPGALLWMWVTAFLGMATKFAECSLAVRYRQVAADGEIAGGPMYTLADGAGLPRVGQAFAVFALLASFGIGNMVQANSVVDGLQFAAGDAAPAGLWLGLLMAALVGTVIVGGIRRIAATASALVPLMALGYIVAALAVLVQHAGLISAAFGLIVESALNPAAAGGAALGEAIRWGVARGLFSNEAGLGSSPMAHAAAQTDEPVREGLVAMLEPLIDTLVICTLTGLVIVTAQLAAGPPAEVAGAALTAWAFSGGLGVAGGWVVGAGLALFAFSTMIAWSYYGDRCARFLFGARAVLPYRLAFTVLVAVGATVPLELVWNLADIFNLLMALPNLLSLLLLAPVVRAMQRSYFAERRRAAAS